jgi:Na+-transporting methylmalonyl-CoA/oxaloacetate decarboxylase gamma subunit
MIKAFFSDEKYTSEELNARLKFFIGIILGLTLFGIVFVVLYSLIFVTQPMNGMSPVDNKFFELIIPVATFLTGTLSGIMLAGDDKDARMKAIEAATKAPPPSPVSQSPAPVRPSSPSPLTFTAPAAQYTTTTGMINIAPTQAVAEVAPQVITGFGGKPAPVQPPQPEI